MKEHDCSHVMASLGVVHSMWLKPEDLDQIIDSHCGTPVAEKEHFIPNTSSLFDVRLFSIDHYFSIFPVFLSCSAGPSGTGLKNKPKKRCCHCIVRERDWFIFFHFLLTCFCRCSFHKKIDFFQDLPRDVLSLHLMQYNNTLYAIMCQTHAAHWYCFNRYYNNNI